MYFSSPEAWCLKSGGGGGVNTCWYPRRLIHTNTIPAIIRSQRSPEIGLFTNIGYPLEHIASTRYGNMAFGEYNDAKRVHAVSSNFNYPMDSLWSCGGAWEAETKKVGLSTSASRRRRSTWKPLLQASLQEILVGVARPMRSIVLGSSHLKDFDCDTSQPPVSCSLDTAM